MAFLDELKRRKVIGSVIAYLVTAFAVAQGAQLLVDTLELPRVILKVIVIVAIVALPVVIVVAWMFDASSSGLQPADQSRRSISWSKVVVATVIGLVAVVGTTMLLTKRGAGKSLDHDLIAVLPFRVTGTADLTFLREGMLDLLTTKLAGESGTRAADPRAVLSALAQKKLTDAQLGDGREFAKSLGAGQVLAGSIVGSAQHFTISASLVDVDKNTAVPATVEGTLDSLTNVVDKLAAALLSLRAGESTQRMALLTSTSLPALRAYLDGQAAFRMAHFHQATQSFSKALDLDSTFALAAMGHLLSAGWGDVPDNTTERSRVLLRHNLNRLGPIDRLVGVALVGEHDTDIRTTREKIQAWEAVLAKAPDRSDAWFEYGDQILHFGALAEYTDSDFVVERAFARALKLDSMNTVALVHLTDYAIIGGDRAEVLRLDAIRARRDPTSAAARYQFGYKARFLGDSAALQALRASLDTIDFSELYVLSFGPVVAGTGVGDAVFAIDKWLARATTREEKLQAYDAAHLAYDIMGMPVRAAAMLRARAQIDDNPFDVHVAALSDALYVNGDTALALEAVAALRQMGSASAPTPLRAGAACFVDQWELLHNRVVDVSADVRALRTTGLSGADSVSADLCALILEALHADAAHEPNARQKLDALDAFLRPGPHGDERLADIGNVVTSQLYERAGNRVSALRAMRRSGYSTTAFSLGETMMREEARLTGLVGERAQAIKLYQKYLAIHSQAEAGLKAEDDAARRDLARLTGEH